QNQPNPVHNSTVIRYQIPSTNQVTLLVYDIAGNLVETLVDDSQELGDYQVEWDGKNQASGIYFYKLEAGEISVTKKLIFLK
ncbi:T9SS type A sorting domain-containing protein, partial [candidate division TA06 bacterium]|nr:T9SS type A sorting domain-containing protein [candidate division TA06 bacterium]